MNIYIDTDKNTNMAQFPNVQGKAKLLKDSQYP